VVRARNHDDGVLAFGNGDQRHSGGGALGHLHMARHHALTVKPVDQLASERVVADRADHHYLRAEPARRHRLVGALAARAGDETFAAQRLARRRKATGLGDQIHIDTANYHYLGHGPSCWPATAPPNATPWPAALWGGGSRRRAGGTP